MKQKTKKQTRVCFFVIRDTGRACSKLFRGGLFALGFFLHGHDGVSGKGYQKNTAINSQLKCMRYATLLGKNIL